MHSGTLRRRPGRVPLVVAAALVVAATGLVTTAAPTQAAAPSIAVLGSTETLLEEQPVPAGRPTSASVSTARNEFESFQIAVTAGDAISSLRVDTAGDLTGAAGTLPASDLTFYRESSYTVQSTPPALDNRTDGESTVGHWPDALVPETDYVYGEYRSAFSAPVAAGGRAMVWVDVLAPQDQPAGTYTGAIRIKDGSTVLATVPLSVTVRSITLPSTSSLPSLFLTEFGQECDAHTGHFACSWDSAKAVQLQALYERVALENRLTISDPWPVGMNQDLTTTGNSYGEDLRPAWNQYVKPVVNGTTTPAALGSQVRLPGARATVLALRGQSVITSAQDQPIGNGCTSACLQTWKAFADSGGWGDRLVYYACDEPGTTDAKWQRCADNHAQLVASGTGLRELMTAPVQRAAARGADAWVDDLVVSTSLMAGRTGDFQGNQRPAYDGWLADSGDGQANEAWLYTACDQGGCDGPTTSATWNVDYWNGWPGYGIDQPASQARAVPWLDFLYGATGELYWGTTVRLKQAWNACTTIDANPSGNCLYESGMGGDGTLFYPGKPCLPGTGPGCIGGTHDIPLESIRLKRLRDGREDYEYLTQLAASGDPADRALAHDSVLGLLGGSLGSATYSTTVSQGAVDQARDSWAAALDGQTPPPPPPTYRPDAMVRLAGGSWHGDDAFPPDVADQTVTSRVHRRQTRTFEVRVVNDGNAADNWSLAQITGGPRGVTYRWLSDGADVTADVRAGTLSFNDVAPGSTRTLQLVVKAGRRAPLGRTWTWYAHAVHDPVDDGIRDVVLVKVRSVRG